MNLNMKEIRVDKFDLRRLSSSSYKLIDVTKNLDIYLFNELAFFNYYFFIFNCDFEANGKRLFIDFEYKSNSIFIHDRYVNYNDFKNKCFINKEIHLRKEIKDKLVLHKKTFM